MLQPLAEIPNIEFGGIEAGSDLGPLQWRGDRGLWAAAYGKWCDYGLPERIPSAALLPIGWPRGRYGRPARRPVDEKLFVDRFDASVVEARE